MKNKRQDVETDTQKREPNEPTSPTARVRPVTVPLKLFRLVALWLGSWLCDQRIVGKEG